MIGMASVFVAGAPAVEPARFLDEARALKSILDAHARSDRFDSEQIGPWD